MATVIEQLNAWAEMWSTAVVAVLWQSTLVALLIAGVAWLLRRSSPAVRYWLWQIVAVKLLVMPFWSVAVPLPWMEPAEPQGAPKPESVPLEPPPMEPPDTALREADGPLPGAPRVERSSESAQWPWWSELTWPSWLLLAWGSVVVLQSLRLVRQRVRLRRLLQNAAPAEDGLLQQVRVAGERLRLKRSPQVLLSDAEGSPFVCGLLRPTLVLPRSLVETLHQSRLRHVILHELAHLQRRDLVLGWIPYVARMLWFFHPVAWWAAWRIRLEQELACDQLVMATAEASAADYAETLVQVVGHVSEPAAFKTGLLPSAHLDGGESRKAHGSEYGKPKNKEPEL